MPCGNADASPHIFAPLRPCALALTRPSHDVKTRKTKVPHHRTAAFTPLHARTPTRSRRFIAPEF
jgi:hypothetical protein